MSAVSKGITKDEIVARISRVLIDSFDLAPEQLRPDAHLIDDLDLDSIDAVSLAARLESEIGVVLKDESLRELRTVADVMELVERLRPDRSA